VIVIIGLIAGLVAPRYFETVSKSKVQIAKAQMASLEKALEQYRLETGTFPTQDQGLQALITKPADVPTWQGPYLKKNVPLDPWNHPYIYKLSETGSDIDIISLGEGGQAGGSPDSNSIHLVAQQQ
jgi:general secretion pathway protein G